MPTILQNHCKYLLPIDYYCKTQSDVIETIENRLKWMLFLLHVSLTPVTLAVSVVS